MGGDITIRVGRGPVAGERYGTDMAGATERVAHIAECRPEICTLDCGTMNFAEADYVMTNTPGMLRAMGAMMTELGVKPEIEAFDTGHLWFAKQLVEEGILTSPALGAALHGRAMGRAGRSEYLHGDGEQCADGLDLFGVLAGPQSDALCGGVGSGGRACAGRVWKTT